MHCSMQQAIAMSGYLNLSLIEIMGILWIKLKQIKKIRFSSSVMPATCQVLSSHIWLMATKLERRDYGTFPSWQNVLLDSSDPESPLFSGPWSALPKTPSGVALGPCCSLPPPAPECAEAPVSLCLALTPKASERPGGGGHH